MSYKAIYDDLHLMFHDKERITNKKLKETLQEEYNKYGLPIHARGTDILLFGYSFKKCKIRIKDKRVDGVILYICR